MHFSEVFLLVAGSLVVTAFARRLHWSAPLTVMTAAFGVSIIPGMPSFEVDGELILGLVLPPLVYSAALDVGYLNFRGSFRQIRRLGVGLPIVTTLAVGFAAWAIVPELGLPLALLLGAIVSPSDAVSAASIGRRLGLPRRVMSVLSGESLVNDATSLTLFKVFAAVVVGTSVTVGQALATFGLAVGVGIAVGLVIGRLLVVVRRRSGDALVLGTAGLLVPFAAYALAERLQGSGVLAVVAAGLVIGFDAPRTSYATRLQEQPVWRSIDLILEGAVFALIGLQLRPAVSDVVASPVGLARSLAVAGVVLVAVVLVRFAWVYGGYGLGRAWARFAGPALSRRRRGFRPEPRLTGGELFVIGWSGMRGVVTLATAASIPFVSSDRGLSGTVFLVAFAVTVGTLLLQGLSLAAVVRRIGVTGDDEREQDRRDLRRVLHTSAESGLAFIESHRPDWRERHGPAGERALDAVVERMRRMERGLEHDVDAEPPQSHALAAELQRLTRDWIAERRRQAIAERDAGRLDEEVMRELLGALDAEEFALDLGSAVDADTRDRPDGPPAV